MNRGSLQTGFFLSILIGVLLLTFFLFLPYLIPLAIAAILAVLVQPLYRWFLARIPRQSGAAGLTVLVAGIVLILPLWFIIDRLVREAATLIALVSEEGFQELLIDVERGVERFLPGANIDLQSYVVQTVRFMAGHVGALFAGTVNTLIQFFLGVIAFYYFVKDGKFFLRSLMIMSPLPDHQDQVIFKRLEIAVTSIVRGSIFVAILQGFVSGIGYGIFGLPSPTLWGGITAFAAFVPGIGTAAILIPSIVYLYLTGNTFGAVGLAIWGVVAVGLIDNLLGPLLVGRGVRIHPFFILLGVIGGVSFFGPLGVLLGPLVISLLVALLDIYSSVLHRQGQQ